MTLAHVSRYMIFFQTILLHNLSLTIAHCFFFAKKLSKLCFSASGNSAENKSVLYFHPFSLLPKDSKDEPPEIYFVFPYKDSRD